MTMTMTTTTTRASTTSAVPRTLQPRATRIATRSSAHRSNRARARRAQRSPHSRRDRPSRSDRLRCLEMKGLVLVVDDDDDIRDATRDVMERHGFEVVGVGGGAEALAFLSFETPTLVLLDLHMDDMNGWEVLGAIRDNPRFAKTKVVVVTGFEGNIGVPVKVLRKPFKIDALMTLLGLNTPKTLAS